MMEATMGRRRTGLTRAKRIERLTLWLGLPLLLLLLTLTAGLIGYTPIRHRTTALETETPPAAPTAEEEATSAPTMPMRSDRLMPLPEPDDLGQNIQLDAPTPVS